MNKDEQTLKDLEQQLDKATDMEQAKQLALDAIIPECRGIARRFFDCVDTRLSPYQKKKYNLSFEKLEAELNNFIIPECLKLYDIDQCLKDYEQKI